LRDLAAHPSLWKLHFLTELFPSLKVIDKRVWKTFVDLKKLDLHIEDDPFFNERLYMIRVLIPVLKRLFSQLVVNGDAGLTLLTIPKNHTLPKIKSIVRSPKQGNQMDNFGHISPDVAASLNSYAVEEGYRVILSNNCLVGTHGLSPEDQSRFVAQYGGQLPRMLDVTTLAGFTYLLSPADSPARLFPHEPQEYTRTEEICGGYHGVFGDNGEEGFDLNNYSVDAEVIGAAFMLEI